MSSVLVCGSRCWIDYPFILDRMAAMLERTPDYVLAFYFGGGGTADTIAKVVNIFRIPTIVYRRDHATQNI